MLRERSEQLQVMINWRPLMGVRRGTGNLWAPGSRVFRGGMSFKSQLKFMVKRNSS
ncbi:MAG: hypothetical protein ACJAQT_004085 [Akkermansiaceae bacterium]|jgi:hypothetical protein